MMKENKSSKIKIIMALAIFLIFIILPLAGAGYYEWRYHDKIIPGLWVGDINLSGLSKEQAKDIINNRVNNINQQGIAFYYHNQNTVLYPLISSLSGDVAIEVMILDVDNSVDAIYNYGRQGRFWNNLIIKTSAFFNSKKYPMLSAISDKQVDVFLHDHFSHFSAPAEDAKLSYTKKNSYSPYKFSVIDEKYGQIINFDLAKQELINKLKSLDNSTINLSAKLDYPKIYSADALNIDAKAQKVLASAPYTFIYDQQKWPIYKNTIVNWLALRKNTATATADKIIVGLNPEPVKSYLEKNISPLVDREPLDAKFEIKDGKVVEFQVSQNGQKLDISNTIKKLETAILQNSGPNIELSVVQVKSEVNTDEINDHGIKEIIGIGHSNFSGSPQNRRHNIGIGAASINGTLIAPDQEFSLLKVLGDISKKTGYLPELVIKEGKTIPEYGGGLCQIGTTMFRGTVDSGLPVTMRRNHSYRVSYYEPAGTDATIYDPWPDYKFMNDTGSYILLQSRIEGNDLYFEFWGTKDGRTATSTYPIIYNITKPAPTKIIETLDLKPGEKKCTEHAHNGADAYFDYIVTYANGQTDETRFRSHYTPWRAVCLLGVEALSTSTEDVIDE